VKNKIKYINLTPTWSGLIPALIELVKNGNADAEFELRRLAKIADKFIADSKKV